MSLKLLSMGGSFSANTQDGIRVASATYLSNAVPVVTFTAGHQLKTGDRIGLSGTTTGTSGWNINGDWTVTMTGTNTATLDGAPKNTTGGAVTLTTTNAIASRLMDKTPHMENHAVVATGVGTGTVNLTVVLQGSAKADFSVDAEGNGAAPSTLATWTGTESVEVVLPRYVRTRTTAWTSGSIEVRLLS